MAESDPIRVLYMEDNAGLARLLKKRLEREGYVVDVARDGEEGLAMYDAASYDIVAVDQSMPVYDGLEVIGRMASRGPLPPLIMVTGTGNEEIAVEAMKMGAHDYIVKDVEGGYLDLLPSVIDQVIRQHHLTEEKRKTDEALRQYAVELEARNEELDAFAHTVAHDLQNPLGVLIGYGRILTSKLAGAQDEIVRECVDGIVRTGDQMTRIIDELLLLSSVRKMDEVPLEPLDMTSIVAGVQERLAAMIAEHQAESTLPPEWPMALGYGPWVEEVWANFISNAVQYSGRPDEGVPPRMELGANQLSDQLTGQPMIRFWIRDNGPGLAPQEQDRLFAEFTRLHQVRVKGYGLGLSIVRRIVEKLGGQVGVESAVGQGSLFYFTLPAVQTPTAGEAQPTPRHDRPDLGKEERKHLRILLVEDSELAQEVVLRFLQQMGHRANVVNSGAEALEALRQQVYDVVLMDVRMPGMDGLETTRVIREELPPDRQPHIIALTTSSTPEDRQACLAAGMDDHISKPFRLEELSSALSQCRSLT